MILPCNHLFVMEVLNQVDEVIAVQCQNCPQWLRVRECSECYAEIIPGQVTQHTDNCGERDEDDWSGPEKNGASALVGQRPETTVETSNARVHGSVANGTC